MGKVMNPFCVFVIILVGLTTSSCDSSRATKKNTTTVAVDNPLANLILNQSNNENLSSAVLSRVKRHYPYYDPYYRYPYPVPIIVGIGGIGVPFGYGRGFGVRGFGVRGFGGRGFGGRGIGGRGVGGGRGGRG